MQIPEYVVAILWVAFAFSLFANIQLIRSKICRRYYRRRKPKPKGKGRSQVQKKVEEA